MADMNQLQMPIANQGAADRAAAAAEARRQANMSTAGVQSRARMQSSLAMTSGQAMMGGSVVAQQAAAIQAREQAAIAAETAKAELQLNVGQAQKELFDTELRMTEQQTIHEEAMKNRHTAQIAKLTAAGRDVKQKLLDDQIKFDRTQREVRFATDRQFADFMYTKTKDENALKEYEQAVNHAIEMDNIMVRSAFAALEQEERNQFAMDEYKRDQALLQKIRAYKAALEAKARAARRKQNGMGRMLGATKVAAGIAVAMTPGGQVAGGTLIGSGVAQYTQAEGAGDKMPIQKGDENSVEKAQI